MFPFCSLRDVAQGYIDTQVVLTNAATFGLVPGVNDRAEALIRNNSFYRAVNIAGIVAREVGLTVATGGGGRILLGAGTALAGRLATRLGVSAATQAGFLCRVTTASRIMQPYFAYQQVSSTVSNISAAQAAFARGDYEAGARLLGRTAGSFPGMLGSLRETARFARSVATLNPQRVAGYLAACFAAGTPIQGEFGSKPIEQYQVGDLVWARPEGEPNGPLELKTIEELFRTEAEIWHLHVGGQVIRTTSEHPIYVKSQGWTAAKDLKPGQILISRDGKETKVEDLLATGQTETVYNFRVADYHTYYVGADAWGFDVWAHNRCAQSWVSEIGEGQARAALRAQGYRVLGGIRNNSGQGIDIVARDSHGRLFFFEVKATTGAIAPRLVGDQTNMDSFVRLRLLRAAGFSTRNAQADALWAGNNTDAATRRLALRLLDELKTMSDFGQPAIRGQLVNITDLFSATKNISFVGW